MSDDVVRFEVDGKPVEGRKGQMIMEVTDRIGAYIPRFCYHEKLSIAANCRMCLIEAEMGGRPAPKPLPACATPIAEGMKVFTKSARAIAAQKATMEFLLINHPLDCPICDQGGECELQDLAMGFGRDVSRYNDRKRVVKDRDIGPLVSTDMTRCIHCTRCVRFSQEIEGLQELGTIGRAEDMKISMYVERAVDHELSANIIDLCPVGALNNKPYRYSARAWEMEQRATVSPHDCVGSNMYAHVLRGTVKRIVPRDNEAINETWLADRDRFGFEGIYANDRLLKPRSRSRGDWREVGWDDALAQLADKLKGTDGGRIGILASPGATVEECHLLARLAEHLGTANIDHRLRRQDFSDQDNDPLYPWLGCNIADLDSLGAILVAGSNLRKEAPIIAHRVRKAALAGASVSFANSEAYEYHFQVDEYLSGDGLVGQLAGIAVAAAKGGTLPASVRGLCKGVEASRAQRNIAGKLRKAGDGLVLLGTIAERHRAASAVRALAAAIASATGARLGSVSDGANAAGAHLAGVLPHRAAGGKIREEAGKHAGDIVGSGLDVLLLFGVEPDKDLAGGAGALAGKGSDTFVVALTPFAGTGLKEVSDLLLPIGTFAETSGTFVNCEGRWQSFAGIANPLGAARPGWKVLRVLGNLLDASGFDYQTSTDVLDELRSQIGELEPDNSYKGEKPIAGTNGADAPGSGVDVPIYEVDAVVRRATALQLTPEAQRARVRGLRR